MKHFNQVFVISPKIRLNQKGQWSEGLVYTKNNIYSINDLQLPPVNYDEHRLKPHSLAHIETPKHTQKQGLGIDIYFHEKLESFFGECLVVKFNYEKIVSNDSIQIRTVTLSELREKLAILNEGKIPQKILITLNQIDLDENGYHNPNIILLLSLEAAQYLTSFNEFNLFGTSWKSSDYQPGSKLRPIHNEIFKKALILENIVLNDVPEGKYWINCFPLQLEEASESPVTAVLFR